MHNSSFKNDNDDDKILHGINKSFDLSTHAKE